MQVITVDNTNFQGKLFIQNKLSRVADLNLNKVKANLEEIIAPKHYNLYIRQDYSYNNVNFFASKFAPTETVGTYGQISIPAMSKSSKYIDAAKNSIDKYEKAISDEDIKVWKQTQKKQRIEDLKDILGTIIFFPLFLLDDILHSINPKWSKKFEKLMDKIL